ncbi:MAG TPA: DUF4157 domain-containing protein [Rhodopila sp.]|uniref:eCIS core domain-containing protein n=1 Tax=Rhodopila sp. TaxID=2480087 RepID=UPI002C6FD6BB|nr:DUF4157 domain-containing protein [Rhodopila sp.]HVY14807.1 DUF4157 domain-containing protein [Rhodopila sp.]
MRRSLLFAPLAWAMPARAQSPIPPQLLDYAGEALASLIETARQRAIADGVAVMPAGIYRSLLGFFPADLLQRVRYGIGGAEPLGLPSLAFSYGDAVALTLGEVVLFKSERDARTDATLWAHELTHVMQYQRWGIESFADRYVRDSDAVEREAIDNAKRFARWQARH